MQFKRLALVAPLALMAAAIAAGAIPSASIDAAFPGYAGKITFIRSVGPGDFDIFTMNADGGEQANITNNPLNDTNPVWSPSGRRIAFTRQDSADYDQIHIMNGDGGSAIQLTDTSANDHQPAWSPDGSRIVFVSDRDGGSRELYVMNADGLIRPVLPSTMILIVNQAGHQTERN